jgi:hypothetical protein
MFRPRLPLCHWRVSAQTAKRCSSCRNRRQLEDPRRNPEAAPLRGMQSHIDCKGGQLDNTQPVCCKDAVPAVGQHGNRCNRMVVCCQVAPPCSQGVILPHLKRSRAAQRSQKQIKPTPSARTCTLSRSKELGPTTTQLGCSTQQPHMAHGILRLHNKFHIPQAASKSGRRAERKHPTQSKVRNPRPHPHRNTIVCLHKPGHVA